MKTPRTFRWKPAVMIAALVMLVLGSALVGCASSTPISEKPGALLWGDNCGHCHNIRPPSGLTDAQWEVAVLHMRTRANLTADEAEKIVEFLKSGN
ncbi:MAG: cytochrome c [Calditrichaeota bacterium]|nr:MAG: cytochrome c [Calditrichota bacterium]